MPLRAWVSKRLDFSLGDWLFALGACASPDGAEAASRVERLWSPEGEGVAGLSVRSLFDAWLAANGWAKGDRVAFTALTVGDMPRIARAHGLEVVAVDVDPDTTAPDPASLDAALGPRTRALVFTHLYGARLDVAPALALCRARGVRFVEDCAEAYAGPGWRGHPDADVALFSFGPIKTATAFGGGLARVADPALRARMREILAAQPAQGRGEYLKRVLKYGLLGVGGVPWVFGPIVTVLGAVGAGHDALIQRLTRGFPGAELLPQIRRRPSAPLLRVLERRLRQGRAPVEARIRPAETLLSAMRGVSAPASAARPHAWWLVPVRARDPRALIERLERAGFNATRGRAFAVVESDDAARGPAPGGARALHEEAVYLPFSPSMPASALERLGEIVRELEAGGANAPPAAAGSPAP